MSNNTNEEVMEQTSEEIAEKPVRARKAATKKTTAKKATAKKVTAKKTTAKKTTARKTATKKAAASDQVELSFEAPPASEPAPRSEPAPAAPTAPSSDRDHSVPSQEAPPEKSAPVSHASAAASHAESAPPESTVSESSGGPSNDSQKRFGRVPGGGPVQHRESSAESATEESFSPEASSQGPASRGDQPPGDNLSRSKRRREKRKRRRDQQRDSRGGRGERNEPGEREREAPERRPAPLTGPKIEVDGMLELAPKGFGFLRTSAKNFEQARDDIFVTPEIIRRHNLRLGQWIHGVSQEGARGPQLVEVTSVNGLSPADASKLPHFDELKAINPNKRISFETTPERFTTRVVDLVAPVGRGQRGLIVSPPRSGKTTLLLHMAEAIREKYDEQIHLMVLLVDERPEEVTEFRRALPGAEIYASSNDEGARSHCRIAELAIERAKRLVEAGKDVFLLMDSITRLARAYNGNMNHRGRGTGSGGITIGALEMPRRLFAAARNTRGGGSLTILATALIQTNSRADEAIFMEFKGTGNMELVLDRKIAENYIYPAVDIFKSGTRREELLLPEHMLHKIHLIRRGLAGHRPVEAMERLLYFVKKFPNNPQMLLEIKG